MIKINGIVEEVYIPTDENIDVMTSTKIGFKIRTEDELVTIEEEQDGYNCNILKGDNVTIIKQVISNKEFIDIERQEDEEYE